MQHQEFHQGGVFRIHGVSLAEAAGLGGAEHRVVAAAPLRDVVEQRGDVEQPGALEIAHQFAAAGEFVCMLGHRETAQIAHDHQDVLIDRVDVEEVVLHAPDDAAKRRQIVTEDRPLVHPAQFVHQAARRLQDLQEQGTMVRIAPEGGIDARARIPQGTQGRRSDAGQLRVLLHRAERLQDRRRCALEAARVGRAQQPVDVAEQPVDLHATRVPGREKGAAQILQHDRMQLHDGFCRPVVALHQFLGGAARLMTGRTQRHGDLCLQVEHEPVLVAPGDDVQHRPDALEPALVAPQLRGFARDDQVARRQVAPALAESGRPGDPQQHVQIAQPARTFLRVGFEVPGGVVVARMPLAHLDVLGEIEGLRVECVAQSCPGLRQAQAAAGQPAQFEQARLHRHVGVCLLHALLDVAHAVADRNAAVPAGTDEFSDAVGIGGLEPVGNQDEQIDVRVWKLFASAISADGGQCRPPHRRVQPPEFAQRPIGCPREQAQQGVRIGFRAEAGNGGRAFAPVLAPDAGRCAERAARTGSGFHGTDDDSAVYPWAGSPLRQAAGRVSGRGGAAADIVRIS